MPNLPSHHTVILRIPMEEYAEMTLLVPGFINAAGNVAYGAHHKYFLGLMRQDLETRRRLLQQVKKEPGNAPNLP